MTALVERLDRWATSLPESEPIPINESEKYELAVYVYDAIKLGTKRRSMTLSDVLLSLNAGTYRWCGHRVEII